MSDSGMTSYAELASVLEALPLLCREKRRREGLSLREAASQIGISFSVVSRFEEGGGIHLTNARHVLRWLGEVPVP